MADIVNIAAAAGLPDIVLGPVANVVVPLAADSLSVLSALGPAPWGVYQGGAPVIVADTVTDLGYVKAYAISDYPIEDGGFSSYDKVELPFEARVRFVSGGSPDVRQDLISSVEGVLSDLNFYDVVTPDKIYLNANFTREEYRRTNQEGGASMLTMDVGLQEVRVPQGSASPATADPSSADQANGGVVQPAAPTSGQATAALPFFATGASPPPTLQ